MLKNAFPLATPSGFVAFDGGGHPAQDAYRVADGRRSIVRPAPAEVDLPAPVAGDVPAPTELGMYRSPTWEPAIGRRARWVEGSVIIAMCAYFVFGFFNIVRG
jgi:hypothetical protein